LESEDVAAVTIFIDGKRATIKISGRLDSSTTDQLRSHVGSLLYAGVTDLLLDLVHAYDLDPELPDMLKDVSRSLTVRGGLLATESMTKPLPSDIKSRSLPEIFEIYRRMREGHHLLERP
jgi:hypothetical protein